MIKKSLIISIILGNVTLLITHLFINKMPDKGVLAFPSKMYFIARLLGGVIWSDWIQARFETSAMLMKIYGVIFSSIFYSFVYGILGLFVVLMILAVRSMRV